MYFIITALAAIIITIIWYVHAPKDKYKLHVLCFIFWGAALMWLVDHVLGYLLEGGAFFDMTMDAALLGITVVLSGFAAWAIILLISHPKGVFKRILKSKS